MSWTKEIRLWETLFELKKDEEFLGIEGMIFFATDYATDLSTGEFKIVIGYPSFNGMNLGKGISSYIVTKEQLEEKFRPIEKTFQEHETECDEKYWNERKKEQQLDKEMSK